MLCGGKVVTRLHAVRKANPYQGVHVQLGRRQPCGSLSICRTASKEHIMVDLADLSSTCNPLQHRIAVLEAHTGRPGLSTFRMSSRPEFFSCTGHSSHNGMETRNKSVPQGNISSIARESGCRSPSSFRWGAQITSGSSKPGSSPVYELRDCWDGGIEPPPSPFPDRPA